MTQRDVHARALYRHGFEDALDGWPLFDDEAPAYVEGWLAAHECRALLETGDRGTVRAELEGWRAP